MYDRFTALDRRSTPPMHEQGAVLVTVLAILIALMIASATAARLALDDERSAQVELDHQLAFQAAEAAQMDSLFNLGQVLVAPGAAGGPPPWQEIDLADTGNVHSYGEFSPAVMAYGEGNLPAHPPGFIVEQMALPGWPADASYFRITSVGFGRHAATFVVLQSLVKVTAAHQAVRLSWREISNWRELHGAVP